jgi:hypothetical protein
MGRLVRPLHKSFTYYTLLSYRQCKLQLASVQRSELLSLSLHTVLTAPVLNTVDKRLVFMLRIMEVLDSNLDPETDYPD